MNWQRLNEELVLSRLDKREYGVVSSKRQKEEVADCLRAKRKVFTDKWQLNDALKELKRRQILLQDGKNRPWRYNRDYYDLHHMFDMLRIIIDCPSDSTSHSKRRDIHLYGFSTKNLTRKEREALVKIEAQLTAAKHELGEIRQKALLIECASLYKKPKDENSVSDRLINLKARCLMALIAFEFNSRWSERVDTLLKRGERGTHCNPKMRRKALAVGFSKEIKTFYREMEKEADEMVARREVFKEAMSKAASQIQAFERELSQEDMDSLRHIAFEYVTRVQSPLLVVIE